MDTKKEKTIPASLRNVGRFRMSYLLFRKSFDLLRKDPHVLLFSALPVLVRFFLIIISVLFSISIWPSYSVFFLLFFVVALLTSWSRAGVICITDERLSDKNMEFNKALDFVSRRSKYILLWSFLSASVGVFLLVFMFEFGLFGAILAVLFWIVWEIGTFYIVSALTVEENSLSVSLKNSFSIIKKNWLETLLVNGVFGFVLAGVFAIIVLLLLTFLYFVKFWLILIAFSAYSVFVPFILLIVRACFMFAFVLLFSAGHSLFSIFNIVLYRYARDEHKDFFHKVTADSYRDKE